MSEMELTNPAVIETDTIKVKVFKHHLASRVAHCCVATGFCACALTGLLLFIGIDIPRHALAVVHLFGAGLLCVAAFMFMILKPTYWARFIDDITHYDKDDVGWIKAPMGGYIDLMFKGREPEYVPPQDKYNTGQKLAGIFLFLGTLALAITGLLMWLNTPEGIFGIKVDLSPGMTNLMWVLHAVFALLTFLLFCVHFFLGAIYKETNVELNTMFGDGYADAAYTKKKHGKWLNGLVVKDETVGVDGDVPIGKDSAYAIITSINDELKNRKEEA